MSDKHSTFNAIIALGVFWAAIFFGVFSLPDVPLSDKYVINSTITIGFFVFGLVYFNTARFRAMIASVLSRRTKIAFWIFIIIEIIDVIGLTWIGNDVWSTKTVDGIPVVTWMNLVSIGAIVIAILFLRDLIRRLVLLLTEGLYA
jgi:hypothetical protein